MSSFSVGEQTLVSNEFREFANIGHKKLTWEQWVAFANKILLMNDLIKSGKVTAPDSSQMFYLSDFNIG